MNVRRYHNFSSYARRVFGGKVRKVTIHAGFTCPNRDGTRGRGGCTFCNNEGFSPFARVDVRQVTEQMRRGIDFARRRGHTDKVIAYFQAYTNTYAPLEQLRQLYDAVWEYPQTIGMAIGTRPDCINEPIADLIASYAARGEVWLELGLQSCHDRTLESINRGHTYAEFVEAVRLLQGRGLKLCAHTILGLPGEDRAMMRETHRRVAELGFDGIKIHLLHINQRTVMAHQYARGEIDVLSRDEYVDLVVDMLEILPPSMVIQRMHADAPPNVLIAPTWCLDKAEVLDRIRGRLVERNTWQGKALGFGVEDLPADQPASSRVPVAASVLESENASESESESSKASISAGIMPT